ncbi:unnamed protein product [Coccothraustes coccothraustes]
MSSAAARVGTAPRSLLRPGGPGSLRSPSAGSAIRRSGVSSVGALRNYFLYWLKFSSRRAALEGLSRRLAGRIAHLAVTGATLVSVSRQSSVAVRVPPDVPYLGLSLCRLCWRAGC